MANEIFTRIQLKYDSWANWSTVKDTFKPLKGEVCVVNPGENSTSCLLKVGDGEKFFGALPWVEAPAADVYAWAKAKDVRLNGQKLEFHNDGTVVKEVDLSTFATEAEVEGITGKLANLATDAKTSLVAAINELDTRVDNISIEVGDLFANVGDLEGLATSAKTNLVGAINEHDTEIGNLSGLETKVKTDLVAAINSALEEALDASEKGGAGSVVTLEGGTENNDKVTYTIKQGGTKVGDIEIGAGDLTLKAGNGLTATEATEVTFGANDTADKAFTVSHAVPTGASAGSTDNKIVTKITTDEFGHVTGAESAGWGFFTGNTELSRNDAYIELDINDDPKAVNFSGENGIKVRSISNETENYIYIDGSELKNAIDATDAKVNTLVGTDTNKSARTIATEVAKAEIGSAGHLKRVFVSSLEEIGTPKADTIYMVGKNNAVEAVFISDQLASFPEEGNNIIGPSWFDGAKCAVYPVTAGTTYTIESIVNGTAGQNTAAFMKIASPDSYSSCYTIELFVPSAGLTKTAPEEATLLYINYASDAETPVVRESASNDIYKEYILNDVGELVQIGDTSVNLEGYAKEDWARQNFYRGIAYFDEGGAPDDETVGGVFSFNINELINDDGSRDQGLVIGLKKHSLNADALSEGLNETIDSKADKVFNATAGNFAALDANGNLIDSGKKAGDFATAAQGELAESAVQSITTGTANGTIKVDGTDVAVKGLGSAAYTASTAYATAAQGAKADAAVRMLESSHELVGGIDISFNGETQGYPDANGKINVYATLQQGGVETEYIADNAVTTAKLQGARKSTGTDTTVDIVIFNCGTATTVI